MEKQTGREIINWTIEQFCKRYQQLFLQQATVVSNSIMMSNTATKYML